jgi:phage baseplate assembly protein W
MANSPSYLFVGFSTIGNNLNRKWTYYDIDLVNRDLMNHFQTRVGERVMRPTWGCKIWDYLMEQMTPTNEGLIINEAINICEEDTRVTVNNVTVTATDNSIRVDLLLLYNGLNVVRTFTAIFNKEESSPGYGA